MPEVVDILIDAENSGAVKGLKDVNEALAKAGSAAEMAAKGVNPLSARMDALSKANAAAAGSSQELSVSWRKQAEAAEAAGGKIAGINSKLESLKAGREHVRQLYGEVDQLATKALKAGVAILTIASALAVTAISGGIGAASERIAVESGLKALMGDAQLAEKHLKDLKTAAGLPGVNLDGAIKMSVGLQGAQVEADYATRSIKALGNELALMGKGDQEFDQAQRALSQMAGAAKLTAEDLNQLRDAGLPVGQILRDAFGTVQIDKIQQLGLTGKEAFEQIVQAMEKAPKAAGGVKNAIENLKIGLGEIQIAFGKGLLSGGAEDDAAKLTANLEKLEKTAYDLGVALVPLIEKAVDLAVKLTDNDGAMLKVIGTGVLLTGGLLAVGGAIGKVVIFASEMKGALTTLGIVGDATSIGLSGGFAKIGGAAKAAWGVVAANPWAAVAVAAAVAITLIIKDVKELIRWYKVAGETRRKEMEWKQNIDARVASGKMTAEQGARAKGGADTSMLFSGTPEEQAKQQAEWKANADRENAAADAFKAPRAPSRPVRSATRPEADAAVKTAMAGALAPMPMLVPVEAQAKSAAVPVTAEAAKGGGMSAADVLSQGMVGSVGSQRRVQRSSRSRGNDVPQSYEEAALLDAMRQPQTDGFRAQVADALATRDQAQQGALLDAIRGRR